MDRFERDLAKISNKLNEKEEKLSLVKNDYNNLQLKDIDNTIKINEVNEELSKLLQIRNFNKYYNKKMSSIKKNNWLLLSLIAILGLSGVLFNSNIILNILLIIGSFLSAAKWIYNENRAGKLTNKLHNINGDKVLSSKELINKINLSKKRKFILENEKNDNKNLIQEKRTNIISLQKEIVDLTRLYNLVYDSYDELLPVINNTSSEEIKQKIVNQEYQKVLSKAFNKKID